MKNIFIIFFVFFMNIIVFAQEPVAVFDANGESNINVINEGDGRTSIKEISEYKGVIIDSNFKNSLYMYFKINPEIKTKIKPNAFMIITAFSEDPIYSISIVCNTNENPYGIGGSVIMKGRKQGKSYCQLSGFVPTGSMNSQADFRFDNIKEILISKVEIYNELPKNLEVSDSVTLMKYTDPKATWQNSGVNPKTIVNKVMCGYQGWFGTPGDEGGYKSFGHYCDSKGEFKPGFCSIDFWPDMSEYEKTYDTEFTYADGTKATVFSSQDASTADLHFKWMNEYNIDGVYIQRFVVGLSNADHIYKYNNVLYNCRIAANKYGRTFAITYDLSGMTSSSVDDLIKDWKFLVDKANITGDSAYLHHNKKPVIEIWGVGFNDNRAYNLVDCMKLVDFFKNDPKYGNCYVVVGVPNGWRELNGDCLNDPLMTEIMLKVDCISPWAPGRYNDIESFNKLLETRYDLDMKWCDKNKKLYMPVVYPGFSWYNMFPETPIDMVPRLKGEFLWAQYAGHIKNGVKAIYQAMFDEIDEGTAIFKCTNNPPTEGGAKFATYDGLSSDYYLKLVGEGKKLLTGERTNYKNDIPKEIISNISPDETSVSLMSEVDKSAKLKNLIGVVALGSKFGYYDVKITRITRHVTERAIERNILVNDMIDALINPVEVSPFDYRENGVGQRFIGEKATVVINPNTGVIITTWEGLDENLF